VHTKQGLMETAETGTLFLDEIGELPTDLQAKLLRAIQEKEIRPVGGTDRVTVASRVIAATNRDLEAMIQKGSFRQDLYFRLNVVQIKLPPLRERKTDIPILVNAFLEKRSAESGRPYQFSEAAMAQILAYDWPGNVRELENAVERATALNSGPVLDLADLPSNVAYTMNQRVPMPDEIMPLEELEKRAILHALHEASGDKLEAAKLLKIGKTTLYRKLKQYDAQKNRLSRQAAVAN
jgi:transcriptional regulator with PAS, ATPase and Fis domain